MHHNSEVVRITLRFEKTTCAKIEPANRLDLHRNFFKTANDCELCCHAQG